MAVWNRLVRSTKIIEISWLTEVESLSLTEAGSGPNPVILGSSRKSSKMFLAASRLCTIWKKQNIDLSILYFKIWEKNKILQK